METSRWFHAAKIQRRKLLDHDGPICWFSQGRGFHCLPGLANSLDLHHVVLHVSPQSATEPWPKGLVPPRKSMKKKPLLILVILLFYLLGGEIFLINIMCLFLHASSTFRRWSAQSTQDCWICWRLLGVPSPATVWDSHFALGIALRKPLLGTPWDERRQVFLQTALTEFQMICYRSLDVGTLRSSNMAGKRPIDQNLKPVGFPASHVPLPRGPPKYIKHMKQYQTIIYIYTYIYIYMY